MMRFALLGLLVGCAADDPSTIAHDHPQQHLPKSDSPSFTLYVSNQSLDHSLVDIQVTIDGELAVSGDFNVFSSAGSEGDGCVADGPRIAQHNWYEFTFDLAPGPHTIAVTSDDVAATFSATDIAEKFGVVTYWYDARHGQASEFGFIAQDERPAFQ